jgi:signal transduction histidine kinase
LRETLDRMRLEVGELHASRKRLVLAADAARRGIERDLHAGAQQHLVALAVNLQRVTELVDARPTAATALLDELGRDVQAALDETAQLAERIYSPVLQAGGLAAALRSAAIRAGVSASVEVAAGTSYPPEFAGTVYLCCLEALEHAGVAAQTTFEVRGDTELVSFELVGAHAATAAALDGLRDRVEALGGRLASGPEPGRGTRISGSLPLSP